MRWLVVVLVGAVWILLGYGVVTTWPGADTVKLVGDGIDIVKKVIGVFAAVAGVLGLTATASAKGVANITAAEAVGPGVFAVVGAILLAS